jgi:signal peptidase I
MTHSDPAHAAPPRPDVSPLRREAVEIGRTVGVGLIAALTLQTLLYQPFTIPSSSMEPGLETGDYIVVSKHAYGWSRASLPLNPAVFDGRLFARHPTRGDVVVFRLPRDPAQTWVKRVIGLPGDRVQVRGGQVFVNDRPIARRPLGPGRSAEAPDRAVDLARETDADGRSWPVHDFGPGAPGDDTPVFRVPDDAYFVMGDNRDNSLDGRWPAEVGVGFLPAENLVGRAELVVASWRPGSSLFKPWTWVALKPGRFLRPIR